jgi:hypothetical protein
MDELGAILYAAQQWEAPVAVCLATAMFCLGIVTVNSFR